MCCFFRRPKSVNTFEHEIHISGNSEAKKSVNKFEYANTWDVRTWTVLGFRASEKVVKKLADFRLSRTKKDWSFWFIMVIFLKILALKQHYNLLFK